MNRLVMDLIGVGVAMTVALVSSSYRADARLRAGCAALLQRLARPLQQPDLPAARNESDAAKAAAALRRALDRLTTLAGSADRPSRLFRPAKPASDGRHHTHIAGLTGRIVQDIAVLSRVLHIAGERAPLRHGRDAALAAGAGLASVAELLAGRGRADLAALRTVAHERGDGAPDALLAAPLFLLLEDLQRLARLREPLKT